MKKIILYFIVFLVGISFVALFINNYWKLNQSPSEYKIDFATTDIDLKDLHLVEYNDTLYIAPNYFLELKGKYQKVEGINIVGVINDKSVLDHAIGGDPFHGSKETNLVRYYGEGVIFKNITIKKDTSLELKISYTVDGVKKEFKDSLKLINYLKKFSY